jgi:uracil-DNA glycosylase
MLSISSDWNEILKDEFEQEYFKELNSFLDEEYASATVYPPKDEIFSAYNVTPYSKVKVVIIGQDPYHNPNQAHGMSFSVKPGVKCPPSLVNIYKELNAELNIPIPKSGYLMDWAKQGVFLLNTVLTVRENEPGSHAKKGWEKFTDRTIKALSESDRPICFMLWGKPAQAKKKLIASNPKHLILESAHPSPLSAYRGFFGCNHFIEANEFLKANGLEEIDWSIRDC